MNFANSQTPDAPVSTRFSRPAITCECVSVPGCFSVVEHLADLLQYIELTPEQKAEVKMWFEQFCAHAVVGAIHPKLAPSSNAGRHLA